jgi:hypothetical protein
MSLPPSEIPLGAIRFNSDSQKLEYWMGSAWFQIQTFSPNLDGGTRSCISMGGDVPSYPGTIEYITIPTAGNAIDFGNQTDYRGTGGALSSRTRGVWFGGYSPSPDPDIDFVTFSSLGDATDFGDMTYSAFATQGLSNSTRGLMIGGSPTNSSSDGVNTVNYITIASAGDAQDFGDMNTTFYGGDGGGCNGVRGVVVNGRVGSSVVNNISFITITTLGNGQDFGDQVGTVADNEQAASNSTRMVIAGGSTPSKITRISFLQIATTGNSSQFGDLITGTSNGFGTADGTRAVFGGGTQPGLNNTIEYVSIATGGTAVDFGDLTSNDKSDGMRACSNGHGGLG